MISKRKQKKIEEYRDMILEFGKGDVSVERATEAATYRYTYKMPIWERIHDRFFNHMSLSQQANNFVIAERIEKEKQQKSLDLHQNKEKR